MNNVIPIVRNISIIMNGFWKTNQNVILGLFYFISPAKVTGPAKIDHVGANYTKLYFH